MDQAGYINANGINEPQWLQNFFSFIKSKVGGKTASDLGAIQSQYDKYASKLSQQDLATFDSLPNDAAKLDFLKTLGIDVMADVAKANAAPMNNAQINPAAGVPAAASVNSTNSGSGSIIPIVLIAIVAVSGILFLTHKVVNKKK